MVRPVSPRHVGYDKDFYTVPTANAPQFVELALASEEGFVAPILSTVLSRIARARNSLVNGPQHVIYKTERFYLARFLLFLLYRSRLYRNVLMSQMPNLQEPPALVQAAWMGMASGIDLPGKLAQQIWTFFVSESSNHVPLHTSDHPFQLVRVTPGEEVDNQGVLIWPRRDSVFVAPLSIDCAVVIHQRSSYSTFVWESVGRPLGQLDGKAISLSKAELADIRHDQMKGSARWVFSPFDDFQSQLG